MEKAFTGPKAISSAFGESSEVEEDKHRRDKKEVADDDGSRMDFLEAKRRRNAAATRGDVIVLLFLWCKVRAAGFSESTSKVRRIVWFRENQSPSRGAQ